MALIREVSLKLLSSYLPSLRVKLNFHNQKVFYTYLFTIGPKSIVFFVVFSPKIQIIVVKFLFIVLWDYIIRKHCFSINVLRKETCIFSQKHLQVVDHQTFSMPSSNLCLLLYPIMAGPKLFQATLFNLLRAGIRVQIHL